MPANKKARRRQCGVRSCRRMSVGALVHVWWSWQEGRQVFAKSGTHACREHLEEATRRTILDRVGLEEAILYAARRGR
jgi:hypothetical protein